MPDKTWKVFERQVATFFKTVRNALSGINSKVTSSDSLHSDLYIECKYRAKSSIHTLYEDTKKKAKAEGKLPVICLKQKNSSGFLIVVHSDDYRKLLEVHNGSEVRPSQEDSPASSSVEAGGWLNLL